MHLAMCTYQEVFLKNRNSGAAAGKEERAIETSRGSIYDLGYVYFAISLSNFWTTY